MVTLTPHTEGFSEREPSLGWFRVFLVFLEEVEHGPCSFDGMR